MKTLAITGKKINIAVDPISLNLFILITGNKLWHFSRLSSIGIWPI
jgi:hypothetical protein